MLTIGQLAAYAGVTVRAVRHYHQIGLLPEPERNRSGYRTYDASAVVRLIRIRILADAGVPLSRVQELLDADQETFAKGIDEIDAQLRAEIRQIRATRKRLGTLTAGEHLSLPPSVVGYLDRLRDLRVDEHYIALERDSWIIIAAQVPDQIDAMIELKHRDLDDPDMVDLYRLLSEAVEWSVDDPRVVEIADVLDRLMTRAFESDEVYGDDFADIDDQFVEFLDATALESAPIARRLHALLQERGWRGWTRIERICDSEPPVATS